MSLLTELATETIHGVVSMTILGALGVGALIAPWAWAKMACQVALMLLAYYGVQMMLFGDRG